MPVPGLAPEPPRLLAATASAAHEVAEDVLEDIGHRRGELRPEAGCTPIGATEAALLERRMAKAVISGPLLGVLQRVVGFVDFLELVLAILVARIAVRMPLHRELAERGLQLGFRAGPRDFEHFIIVALGHQIGVSHAGDTGLDPATLFGFREKQTPGGLTRG
jgi:hypothetical protein